LPGLIVTLSHPDSNRRLRNYTGSADLWVFTQSARGLSAQGWFTAGGEFRPAL